MKNSIRFIVVSLVLVAPLGCKKSIKSEAKFTESPDGLFTVEYVSNRNWCFEANMPGIEPQQGIANFLAGTAVTIAYNFQNGIDKETGNWTPSADHKQMTFSWSRLKSPQQLVVSQTVQPYKAWYFVATRGDGEIYDVVEMPSNPNRLNAGSFARGRPLDALIGGSYCFQSRQNGWVGIATFHSSGNVTWFDPNQSALLTGTAQSLQAANQPGATNTPGSQTGAFQVSFPGSPVWKFVIDQNTGVSTANAQVVTMTDPTTNGTVRSIRF